MPSHAGRNDPCPCGSGRKFKKCCLPKAGPVPAPPPVPVDLLDEEDPSMEEAVEELLDTLYETDKLPDLLDWHDFDFQVDLFDPVMDGLSHDHGEQAPGDAHSRQGMLESLGLDMHATAEICSRVVDELERRAEKVRDRETYSLARAARCKAKSPRLLMIVPGTDSEQPAAARACIAQCADEVIELGLPLRAPSFLRRNAKMLECADVLIAFWDGRPGGTSWTLNEARRHGIPAGIVPLVGMYRLTSARGSPLRGRRPTSNQHPTRRGAACCALASLCRNGGADENIHAKKVFGSRAAVRARIRDQGPVARHGRPSRLD
jgi:hypothetical protein